MGQADKFGWKKGDLLVVKTDKVKVTNESPTSSIEFQEQEAVTREINNRSNQ